MLASRSTRFTIVQNKYCPAETGNQKFETIAMLHEEMPRLFDKKSFDFRNVSKKHTAHCTHTKLAMFFFLHGPCDIHKVAY